MRNRYLVLGLASFLAIALAVPALGGPSNPIANTSVSALTVATKAKKKAKAAQSAADAAQASANAAQSTANSAQAAAAAAQTTANTANTNANNRFDDIDHVEGTTSTVSNADKALVAANCPDLGPDPGDGEPATGGGWVTSGAAGGERDAQVEYSSTFYADQWVVVANDLGLDAGTWSITPTVQCIGKPGQP